MTLNDLYLLNNDWDPGTEIVIRNGLSPETMEMREAIRIYGRKRVIGFSVTEVWLHEN